LRFLSRLARHDRSEAFGAFRNATTQLLSQGSTEAMVDIELHLDDGATKTWWQLRFPMESLGVRPLHGESLTVDGKKLAQVNPYETDDTRDEDRTCLRALWDAKRPKELASLIDFLGGLRTYKDYRLDRIGEGKAATPGVQAYLHPTGINLAHVLAAWRNAPTKFGHRFEWVRREARRAFPDVLSELEFESHASGLVFGSFAGPGAPDEALEFGVAADGLLTGLLHLTAVAGAEPGSVVAIDEIETHLHPYAIRIILSSIRERAASQGLSVIVTTQSPVVLDEFDDYPEDLFVLEPGHNGPGPVAVTDLRDEQWLANFSLGELYERQDFGTPERTKTG
jgi:predicted ATPase